MKQRSPRIQIQVDKGFYDYLKKVRNELSQSLPSPIKSDLDFTSILMNKNLVKFNITKLKQRRFK